MAVLIVGCLSLVMMPRQVVRTIDGSDNVLPRTAIQDTDYRCLGNTEAFANMSGSITPPQCTDGSHVTVGKFGASRPFASGLSPFTLAIRQVVSIGPQKQMVNVDTWRIVAGVKNLHPNGDQTTREKPSSAVSLFNSSVQSEMSIALAMPCTHPYETPADVRACNLQSKPFCEWTTPSHIAQFLLGENGFAIPTVVGPRSCDYDSAVSLVIGVLHGVEDTDFLFNMPTGFVGCWSLILTPADVLKVHDGDTVYLRTVAVWPGISATEEHVRILGVDTPELRDSLTQPAREARAFTQQWLAQGPFTLYTCKRDSFGRLLATVSRGADTLAVALATAHLTKPL